MPASNSEIAHMFSRYATLLEIEGANPFRVRAYRNAALTLKDLSKGVADLLAAGEDLTELEGIGDDLAEKIAEIVETRRLRALDEIEQRMPGALADLAAVPGLGPKRIKRLYDELEIRTAQDLERAAKSGQVRELSGFGPKTEQKLLAALATRRGREERMPWVEAEEAAGPLVRALERIDAVSSVDIAGSFRRRRETVGDLDVLVVCTDSDRVMRRFVDYDDVAEVVSSGTTRATVILQQGLQVDLRVVPAKSRGAALQYFTGSKAHNIALRARAGKRGLKLNEYGLFDGDEQIAGRTERQIYKRLELAYIEPELREGRGEIEAAEANALPSLVRLEDLRGDLHCHTNATDGHDSLERMARAAEDLGHEYLAITDHTQHLNVAGGLDSKQLDRQLRKIDRLNDKLDKLKLLKSAEVDILDDGSLDLSDDLLGELDIVIGAVHSNFSLSKKRQTERIIRAMDNPHFNILAHPSGRLLDEREAYAVDKQRLMEAALERGCFLEVNAQPQRLDLTDSDCRMAKEMGLKLAISTDAHSAAQLGQIRLGIAQARRGWLEASDVLNTQPWSRLAGLLRRQ